jgi:hypothetical protein
MIDLADMYVPHLLTVSLTVNVMLPSCKGGSFEIYKQNIQMYYTFIPVYTL